MKIGAAGVHNQPLLPRFLPGGVHADVTPITKSRKEHATVKEASHDAKIQPSVSANPRVQKRSAEERRSAASSAGKTAELTE